MIKKKGQGTLRRYYKVESRYYDNGKVTVSKLEAVDLDLKPHAVERSYAGYDAYIDYFDKEQAAKEKRCQYGLHCYIQHS